MGRTGRHRKAKSCTFKRLDHESELVALNSWLARNGTQWNKKLGYANFNNVGRGVIANRALSSGELIVDLPLTLTINITTMLLDEEFTHLFTGCEINQHVLSLQSVLAFYLLYLKYKSSHSEWHVYMLSLPTEYSVPYFLSDVAKKNLEISIRSVVELQEIAIKSSHEILSKILRNKCDVHSNAKLLYENYSLSDYEWAYFTVNTRCVYMDLSDIIDLSCIDNPILKLLNDNPTIALCPYLDMINHSSSVKTQTTLKVTGNSTPLKEIGYDALSHIRFHLYTMNSVRPYSEVYICYGDSHNLKLVTEYGFYLPSNSLDSVRFDFETVKNCLNSQNIKLSHDQCRFINTHNLSRGLYVDCSGLSFNFYALLTVLKFYNSNKNDLSKVIYSSDIGSSRNNLNEAIIPLINEKIEEIENCIAKVIDPRNDCVNLENCVNLMQRYIAILRAIQK